MNKNNIFYDLNNAYQKCIMNQQELDWVEEKIEREIKNAEEKIRNSYIDELKNSHNKLYNSKEQLNEMQLKIAMYSTFKIDTLGRIIELLVNTVEKEHFIYQECLHDTYERRITYFGGDLCNVLKYIKLVILNDKIEEKYVDRNHEIDTVANLVKSNSAIVISSDINPSKQYIRLYEVKNDKEIFMLNLSGFSYVKDFIDLIIEYRYQNQLEEISETELLELLDKFLEEKDFINQSIVRKKVNIINKSV